MVDPSNALHSFQEEFLLGNIRLEPGSIYPDLYTHYQIFGENSFRVTYVRFDNKTVISFVNIVPCEPVNGTHCFQMGYAVPEAYRNRGLAKETIQMVLKEMKQGYQRAGITKFYVETIIEANNKPSLRVAEQTISSNSTEIIDKLSGAAAFQFLRKIE
jgi:hypothetical protein